MLEFKSPIINSKFYELSKKSHESLLARGDLGFLDLTERSKLWMETHSRANSIKSKFKRMAILGIGGSSLGGLALREMLGLKNLDFFENVDSEDFFNRLKNWGSPLDTHWVIVSKSGRTIETLTQTNFVYHWLLKQNVQLSQVSTVITETRPNPLFDWAISQSVPVLEVPLDVGGRFSVLSPVGLLPAAFSEASIDQLREGARLALKDSEAVIGLTSAFLSSFENEKYISVLWSYCNRLRYFGLWWEQLWAESLGKKMDRLGRPAPRTSTPISLLGANDQHSVLQQLVEGAADKFVCFLRVRSSEGAGGVLSESLFPEDKEVVGKTMGQLFAAEAEATQLALIEAAVPTARLTLSAIDSKSCGYLFMFFQLLVGTLGEALDIDAFDQPGVELGKRLAKEILRKTP